MINNGLKNKLLVAMLGASLAMGCVACGSSDSSDSSAKESTATADKSDKKDKSAKSGVETFKGGPNDGMEIREYSFEEKESGLLESYVPRYLTELDCSKFDSSLMPTTASLSVLGEDGNRYSVPLNLPFTEEQIQNTEGVEIREDEDGKTYYYKGGRISSFGVNGSSMYLYEVDQIKNVEGFADNESFDSIVNALGNPSGYAVCNSCVPDETDEPKTTKNIYLVYEYDEYVFFFNFVDVHYYKNVNDESYRPEGLVGGYFLYYSKEAWDDGAIIQEFVDEDFYDLVYTEGTLDNIKEK